MATQEMRSVYVETLIALAERDERIMVCEADLMRAHGTTKFADRFPGRAVDVGVAEANLVGVSAGLSLGGKIPFAATFGCFASRRAFDQFFLSANYARLNVKLVGTDPGVTAAFNGGTHMPFEDVGLMRMVPGLTIFEPADPVSLRALMKQSASMWGCTYMRLPRKSVEPIYEEGEEFTLGKGKLLFDGDDVTIIAMGGLLVGEAIKAHGMLAEEGIDAAVIDMHTVKPLDEELVLHHARKSGAVVTAENHQIAGGLGAAVANCLSCACPTPMRMVGIRDEFGQVGTQAWLQQHYRLTADEIVTQVKDVLNK
ncbi:MAG TPA: transketolase C-terminal domain-containing protein [Sphaerochaeta sp.]|nr:transketolase C-terminal domain-containing protein [Sphaerochaeta sp.]HOQ95351.1 transketolase C-terminal domain-containing protein [Sphaerochaeta sp.]HPK47280.1 transketolase C-terminal domain-containing protein [Sphaerochaeta sp.]HPY12715.1 transketolase C-terminal domain-containing protein [Sphaerochaeta sp.]